MSRVMSSFFSAGGGESGVTYVSDLTSLKAAFSNADGGTGAVTANEIRLTADISNIDVNLEFRSVHRLTALGGMKTLSWDGTHYPIFSRYSVIAGSGTFSGWSRATVTGSSSAFLTDIPMTAGRRYIVLPSTGNAPPVDVYGVTNNTSLETGQMLETYVATAGVAYGIHCTGSGYYYADVCFDFNGYHAGILYWELSDVLFDRCSFKNFNSSSTGPYYLLLRSCSNVEFRSCPFLNFASTGDYYSPFQAYQCHNVTFTQNTAIRHFRGYNSSGGVIAAFAHSYCTDIGFVGARVEDMYNSYDANNGTYGIWDSATSYYSYYLGVNVLGVKLKAGRTGTRPIFNQGANCLIVGGLFKGCDTNVASYTGTTTYVGNEDS